MTQMNVAVGSWTFVHEFAYPIFIEGLEIICFSQVLLQREPGSLVGTKSVLMLPDLNNL